MTDDPSKQAATRRDAYAAARKRLRSSAFVVRSALVVARDLHAVFHALSTAESVAFERDWGGEWRRNQII